MNTVSITRVNSYLSFKLGKEEYAVHYSRVLNILEINKLTTVPGAPNFMKGVINLRGTVLPVIDTKLKVGMHPIEYTKDTCIVVLEIIMDGNTIQVGALVDGVQSLLEVENGEMRSRLSIDNQNCNEYIEGIVNIEGAIVNILNMDVFFSASEVSIMMEKTEEAKLKKTIERIC